MKLSKKILAAFSAATLLATAAVFTSCTEDDNDTEGAISGSGKNYTINYTNSSTTDIYRCWNTTTFKHEGELVKITLNSQTASSHDGVMGFVWDLRQSKDAAAVGDASPAITEKGYQNFFVAGFQWHEGTPRYYISKYFNVTDVQAENFGASTTVNTHGAGILATEPKEIEVQTWKNLTKPELAADGTVTLWMDIYPVFTKTKSDSTTEQSTYGKNISAHSSTAAGSYVVDLYDTDPSSDETVSPFESTTITTDVTGYTAEPTQGTLAVYANVQPEKTLTGAWNLVTDYAADEVVEE